MNSAMLTNKKGSYIVEAVLCLPAFIISIVALLSIILMYACIEDSEFIMASELRRASVESVYLSSSPLLTARTYKRIRTHSQVQTLIPVEYRYRVRKWDTDELIILSYRMSLKSENPIGLASEAEYRLSGVTRAYVGRARDIPPMSLEEFEETGDETVFIFPKSGEKYHQQRCTYVYAACRSDILSSSLKRRYSSCAVCKSKNAPKGSLVYVFPKEGEAYHLPGCDTINRNYIEVMKRTARRRGYKPCSKCGG